MRKVENTKTKSGKVLQFLLIALSVSIPIIIVVQVSTSLHDIHAATGVDFEEFGRAKQKIAQFGMAGLWFGMLFARLPDLAIAALCAFAARMISTQRQLITRGEERPEGRDRETS